MKIHLLFPQLCSTMCNSSFIICNASIFEWFCICEGHFGTYFVLFTSILYFSVGTPVHCWFLWVLLHGDIKPYLVFPLNNTILELFYCFQSIVDIIVVRYPYRLGQIMLHFVIGLCWTFRPLIQICMCIEQYLAVIHPVTFLRYKGIQYRIALALIAWLIALGNSMRLVSIGMYYFQDHIFFVGFCIAVITTSFCCVSVLLALKRPGPGDRKNIEMTENNNRNNKTDKGRAVENQQKRKAFRIISHILVSILICYMPLVVTYFVRITNISDPSYICEAVPLILSVTPITLLISPLVRLYSEGHLKHILCFSNVFK